jgi:RNase P subunit RPR2
MVLGKNAVCARCNDLLPRGSDAAIGIPEAGGSRLVICLVCLEQLRVPPATTEEPR